MLEREHSYASDDAFLHKRCHAKLGAATLVAGTKQHSISVRNLYIDNYGKVGGPDQAVVYTA